MRTRRFKHLPGVVAWKEHPDGPWYVGKERPRHSKVPGDAWAYMIRRQRNRGWNSAYWQVNMFDQHRQASFEHHGNMDGAMMEIQNRAVKDGE